MERMQRLVDVYLSGAVEKAFFQGEQRRLRERMNELDRELKQLESLVMSTDEMMANQATIQKLYARYKEKLSDASDATKREIFQTFIGSIVVQGDDLDIEVSLPSLDGFAGQGTHGLSRKKTSSIFLRAQLIPVGEIYKKSQRQRKLHQRRAA